MKNIIFLIDAQKGASGGGKVRKIIIFRGLILKSKLKMILFLIKKRISLLYPNYLLILQMIFV